MEFDQGTWQRLGVRLPEGLRPVSLLGQGGGGIVVRARQEKGARIEVACKIAHEGGEERVENERAMLRRLQGVRGVPQILEWGEDGPQLVSNVIDGRTMEECFRREDVTLGQALRLIASLADVLAGVHARGIVHRDVKPENVLVRWSVLPSLVLIDFGLSARVGDDVSESGKVSGTLVYMAPEAFHPSTCPSPAQDLYALGIVLFRVCTGHLPFRGSTPMELCALHHLAPVPDLPSEYPGRLNALVKLCLEKSDRVRLSSAAAFAMALREGVAEMSSSLLNRRISPPEPSPRSRRPVAMTELDVR